jgi:SARP family transcriptional regulator, regulator of embCAB operon
MILPQSHDTCFAGMAIEGDGGVIGVHEFPGQQGRNAFGFLVSQRSSPVSRSALADALWPTRPPPSWPTALSAIVSKLRALLSRSGVDGPGSLTGGAGCYELRLPPDTWVDHEAAADSIHEAEAALKAGDPARAYGPSAVAHHIARRPFLPGEEGPWIDDCRGKLGSILVRALECRAEVYLWNQEYSLAVEAARDAVALRPFRETGYRLLMRAHLGAGNAAEALRVYGRCRSLISEELGVAPSRETRAVHSAVLQSL